MNEDTIAGASMLPDSIEDAIYAVLHPRTVSTVPEHLELRAAISQALADARDEAYDRAAFIARHANGPWNAMHVEALEAAQKAVLALKGKP